MCNQGCGKAGRDNIKDTRCGKNAHVMFPRRKKIEKFTHKKLIELSLALIIAIRYIYIAH